MFFMLIYHTNEEGILWSYHTEDVPKSSHVTCVTVQQEMDKQMLLNEYFSYNYMYKQNQNLQIY